MATESHIVKLEKKISALSDALANLGRGTDLRDLIKIIKNPGWTTPAELAMTLLVLDTIDAQVAQLGKLTKALNKAALKVR